MEYKTLNDNELIYLCNENNEEAEIILIEKYKGCILTILKDYLREYNIIGVEVADLYQEGLIGLIHAIKTYNESKEVKFYTYACACIKTSIMSSIRQTFRQKSRILNNSYSLDKLIEQTGNSFYDIFRDDSQDPTKVLLENEESSNLIKEIKNRLSKNENIVFELKLKGLNNKEITELIDKDKKYVENVMFRINRKYKDMLKSGKY
ncbi:MAG: sigma-70 family RNA polymerase sigma factor [Bacilli bacterium]